MVTRSSCGRVRRANESIPMTRPEQKNSTKITIDTVSMLYLTCKRKLGWLL